MDPITREEMYLAAASGQAVEVPEPITRQEIFLNALVEAVKAGGVSPDAIKEAVNAYLDENPVSGGATTEQAAQITENKDNIELLQDTVETGVKNPNALTLTGAVSATYDGSSPVSVEIPETGIPNTYGEEVELINTTIEIPADEPVLEIILDMPDIAVKLHHFSISVVLSQPTNEHTAGRTMMALFGKNIWYWNMGNSHPTIVMHMWALVDIVRRITYWSGIKNNSLKFNAQALSTHMDSVGIYTESEKQANNTFKLWLENEYAGTAEIIIRGYN